MKKILIRAAFLAVIFISLLPAASRAQDSDFDGMPDAYELLYGCLMPYVDDAAVDYDTDGMTSLAEYTYSPDLDPCEADTDEDGKDDGTELSAGSNPLLDFIAPTPRVKKYSPGDPGAPFEGEYRPW